MDRTVRQRLGDALLRTGIDHTVARQQLEKSLAKVHPDTRGYAEAMQAARSAALVESALLWFGWRLQPRLWLPELLDHS
ncbi:hypothetical protein ACVBEQ_14580 [Nakamurella sp. GG22]